MILLIGVLSDDSLADVRDAVQELGVEPVVVDQLDADQWTLELSVVDGSVQGELARNGTRYDVSELSGMFVRMLDHTLASPIAHEDPDSPRRRHWDELHQALRLLGELSDATVVNRTGTMITSNASKPYQATLIRAVGLDVPETLVTTDPDAARAFWEAHGRVVFKSVGGMRSQVTELTAESAGRLELVRGCPVQFQELIEGNDVRVHTIAGEVFASAIETDATDYRYAHRHGGTPAEITATKIAPDLAERCVKLAELCDLEFAGIDLRLCPDGRAYSFEVNPMPAFSYYARRTGQPIAHAVARHLTQT